MSDYTLDPCSTMLVGMTGSGKTTFAFRYLLNVNAACRFVFDDMGQAAKRLRIPHASTVPELEAALSTRWVLFNPFRMFPGQAAEGFKFFCDWAFKASQRGPGKKVILLDEIWRWCTPGVIPVELATIAQMGRSENLELVCCTQLPHKINSSIIGQSTELVAFRLGERLAIDALKNIQFPFCEELQTLALGDYIAINRVSRGVLRGSVFE